jgi:DNA-binding NarL/FixJ family response regulator
VSSRTAYHIVLADDHVPFRQGLKSLLKEEADLVIVGEAGDGRELVSLLKQTRPHMVILDLSMPHMDGFEAACEIRKCYPEVCTLILTLHKEAAYVQRAVSAGARGYVLKEKVDTELLDAIRSIREGGAFFPSYLTGEVSPGNGR